MRAFRRKRISLSSAYANINVTPLIDVLLVLIVIFMVIAPLTPKGFDTNIPSPPQNEAVKKPDAVLVLSIDQNGGIRLNQETLELSSLSSRLQGVFSTRADRTVFVQGNNDLVFDQVAQLIDIARGAGADRIGLMTEQIAAH